ncbi:hypothetical protein [Streptomyces cyaneofuscatus]|uniref:Uncharacterized protein n=1 Tax=Streptomyces cyaneofuscatus TaxID=66883 RepID=A0ABZ1EUG7_9ACTN|nr:hypothetical protein [Streptomyces cyaneofuscatus]WSB07686.1 hypothetical protein OG849_10695 [Streptomyces cyaneofuscatus]WSD48781.1 hypothetical protein OG857_24705 [Streptomyces cyaneofuscatus]
MRQHLDRHVGLAHCLYRLDILPLCPARLRDLATHTVTPCAYFDHHPAPHSFFVTDPLGDLITSPNGIDEP